MPRLLLHIGTHKTGTTSIQRFCAANRDALRDRGVWYPRASVGRFKDHYAHHHIAHAIAGRRSEYTMDDAADFFAKVRQKMRADETCLISAEPLYRHLLVDPDEVGRRMSDLAAQRSERMLAYVRAVKECIGDFEVTVLVMLRRQDLFLESLYAEQVLSTGYNRLPERFVNEREHLLDYDARLADWSSAFGTENISVAVFERAALGASIEQAFVEWIGLDWSDDFTVGTPHNVTPSRALVELKRQINTSSQSVTTNNMYRRWVEQLAARVPADELPDLGRYYLQPRDRVELLEQFADGNRNVAETYCGRTRLFTEDVAADLAKYVDRRGLTQAEYRNLVQHLLLMIATEIEGE